MSVPSPFLINSFSSFCLLLVKSSATDLNCFGPFNSKKLPSVKSNSSQPLFDKLQNILTSAP